MTDGPMLPSRRTFLRGAGAAGIGAAALTALGPAAALATPTARWRPDPDSPRFTLAVIPDTQYLFDQDRGDAAPLDASLKYILDQSSEQNIVFVSHLGDLTENGLTSEFDGISRCFRALDRHRAGYAVLAGNHDIDAGKDDQRGPSPYLDAFGPHRFRRLPTFGGATPDGYNTYHRFRAAGREWLVLALDWRPSAGTLAWAQGVLDRHPRLPVILTTHDLAEADAAGQAELSDLGHRLWDTLIAKNDQIFLTLNGHYWPPGRTVLRNAAGNDVHVHITNYQDRYYGGSAMIRLYRFDLARDTIDVETFSPWLHSLPSSQLTTLDRGEIELTTPVDRFSVPIDFEKRFASFAPVPAPAPRPARDVLVPGTVAYWRFDGGQPDGAPAGDIRDLSGRGNHLARVTWPGSGPTALTFSGEHHRDQPGHGSLFFDGAKNPARGAYLRTADGAPLNDLTFRRGYTIEAFIKLPADFADGHAWCGLFTRLGTGADAGKTGDDPSEPLATLNLAGGGGLQWAAFPLNQHGISTNWSHELPLGEWWHVAVVNDGRRTVMYVEGSEVLRNPSTPAVGIATSGASWLLGAYQYGGVVEQSYYGWLGDVRIVDRALPVGAFLRR